MAFKNDHVAGASEPSAARRSLFRLPPGLSDAAAGFFNGLLFVLLAPALFLLTWIEGPQAPTDGIAEDWKRVGADIRAAMAKHGL